MAKRSRTIQIAFAFVCLGLFSGGVLVGRITTELSSLDADDVPTGDVIGSEITGGPDTSSVPGDDAGAATAISNVKLEAEIEQFDMNEITFTPGTDQLTPSSIALLDKVADVLIGNPIIPVEIEVRTFTGPTPGENHGLSTLQAEAIETFLVANGVKPGRLVSVGLGDRSAPFPDRTILLRFDTNDPGLSEELAALDNLVIDLDSSAAINPEGQVILSEVASSLENRRSAILRLIGHGYAESEAASHDLSHELVDAAIAYLVSLGIDNKQLTSVGLGDAPVELELETIVEFELGFAAVVSLALRELDENLITFEPRSDRLTADGLAAVQDVAAAMALGPTTSVEIAAHAYSEETTQSNHDVSHSQGQAVADALVAAGIAADRLQVVGHGDPPHFAQPGRDSYVTFYPLD